MRYLAMLVVLLGWAGALFGAILLSERAVDTVERAAAARVAIALSAAGQDWTVVEADGLNITLSGRAPNLEARSVAISVTELAVGPSSITDQISLPAIAASEAPLPKALRIGRFGALTTLDGALTAEAEQSLLTALPERLRTGVVRRFLELRTVSTPDDWPSQQRLALQLAAEIDLGLITLTQDTLSLAATLSDIERLRAIERFATEQANALPGLTLILDLSAPTPPLPEATLVVAVRIGLAEVLECRLPSAEAFDAVSRMLRALDAQFIDRCEAEGQSEAISSWENAAVAGLTGLAGLDSGTLTLSGRTLEIALDADVSQARRTAVRGSVREALPLGFFFAFADEVDTPEASTSDTTSRQSLLLQRDVAGRVTLDGPLAGTTSDGTPRDRAVLAYARALFGEDSVLDNRSPATDRNTALSLTASLTLLDALAVLDHGTVSRDAGGTSIMGQATGHASSIRSQIQSALGEPLEQIAYNVLTSPARASDGTPVEPDATACAADIASVQAEARIVFAPSSAVINAESGRLLDRIAEIMRGCPATRFRIEGHTDSQGSESINLAISTARAESVLDSLLIRGVFLDRLEARGYGEARPIADNDTPEGRSLNRRIEFSAIPFDGGSP